MAQVARNLVDPVGGFLRDKRFLVLDRDTKLTAQFRAILRAAGVAPVLTAVCPPDMNAVAERSCARSVQLVVFPIPLSTFCIHERRA